jgi:hypothetical protein
MNAFSLRPFATGFFLSLVAATVSCKARPFNEGKKGDAAVKDLADPKRDRTDPIWIYGGPLPQLTDPKVIVSVRGHTARVTGFVPSSWKGTVPAHAFVDDEGGKLRMTVVYPIATVDPNHIKSDGTAATNAEARVYSDAKTGSIVAFPYTPFGKGSAQNANTPWGGFPYIEYNRQRNIAFHGPITRAGGMWDLLRGPVSHACNRMSGEHVVEFAHLLGVNMNRIWGEDESKILNTSVEVLPHDQFDKITYGQFKDKLVDVDYPITAPARSAIQDFPQNAKVFKTWDGQANPTWVCMAENADVGKANPCASGAKASGASGTFDGNAPSNVPNSSSLTANRKVCNVSRFANVRGNNGSDIGDALLNEEFHLYDIPDRRQDKDGNVFRYAFFFENRAIGAPAGAGWIWEDTICNL